MVAKKSDLVNQHLIERAERSRRVSRKSIKEYNRLKAEARKKAEAANRVPQWYIDMVKRGVT